MRYAKYTLFILFLFSSNSYSQHLPLNIGNEWHYNYGFIGVNQHISTAIDTIRIKNKLYYLIENYDVDTHKITDTTYDRIDGDSAYYRIYGDTAKLIFNFAWQNDYIESSPSVDDSTCTDLKLIKRDTINIWGISTDKYEEYSGSYCPTSNDTSWTLSGLLFLKYFGCWNANDGYLMGAKINGTTYGTFLPVPVELTSFSSNVELNSVHLKWSTATEINNSGFEILRNLLSYNGNESKIGFIKGNGTTTERKNYELWDKNLQIGEYSYKLIQIDYDGTRKQIAETKVLITSPNVYTLYQNYPNPFNPTTKIEFDIPNESNITLLVYNIIGEIVYKSHQTGVKAGRHGIIFDGKNLSSGIYYYQIKSTTYIDTKKMLLLR